MVDDCMKTDKMVGLIQPKKNIINSVPDLHSVGCLGKITNFTDTKDGKYLIELKGLNRFCLLYTSPSPRDGLLSRMPSSA